MESGTLPMTRWLDPGQIARIRESVASIAPEAGWFAADVLRHLSRIAPAALGLFGETMAEQRLRLMEALRSLAVGLDTADALRANLAGLDEPAAGWDSAATHVDAVTRAMCDAFAAWPGIAFDDETRAAWQALRVHGTLLLLAFAQDRAAA